MATHPKCTEPVRTSSSGPVVITVSDNNSDAEPMRAIIVLIVDTAVLKSEKGYAALVEIDEGWE